MPLLPIDLQTLFTQTGQVGREQAAQKDAAPLALFSEQLAAAGVCDLNLKPDHVLVSYIPSGSIKTSPDGQIEVRQCNFEMVKEL